MFKTPVKILAYKSILQLGNYVTPNYIISNDNKSLLSRHCPHRMYPINDIGNIINESILCELHGYEWSLKGIPINNDKKLRCGEYIIGKSGLIFSNWQEPNHAWVDDLVKEPNLNYSHTYHGVSNGNWLWMMEIQADLLHIRKGINVVHPELSNITNINDTKLESGEGWALQTCSTGWWLCVFPYTFIEYSKGCLAINFTVPNNSDNEFGFTWVTQFYFDPANSATKKLDFEKYFHDVFLEDLTAIEKYKHSYFPLKNSTNPLEQHVVEFGNWVTNNLKK